MNTLIGALALLLSVGVNLSDGQRPNPIFLTCASAASGEGGPGTTWLEATVRNLVERVGALEKAQDLHKPPIETCTKFLSIGSRPSGIYNFSLPVPFQGVCDMTTDGGGWLVFQRRFDGSVNFYRNWNDYENGFGSLEGEFWLGLRLLNQITKSRPYELMVELTDYNDMKTFAKYSTFAIGPPTSFYNISVSGYSGNAGDGMRSHNRRAFSTYDQDHDVGQNINCAAEYKGAWWYRFCYSSNLNARYSSSKTLNSGYQAWIRVSSFKGTEMKIRALENST